MEPTLCLKCANFPCTCGEQYKNLSDDDYYSLLNNLRKLKRNVAISVDDIPVDCKVAGISPLAKLFTAQEAELFPDDLCGFLSEYCNRHPGDNILDIAVNYNADAMKFPSGLILAILIRCKYPEIGFARLFKKWLKDTGNDVSTAIAAMIDDNAGKLKTTILAMKSELLNMTTGTYKGEPGSKLLYVMIQNALKAAINMLEAIEKDKPLIAATEFMVLMDAIVTDDDLKPDKEMHCKEYLESSVNFDIYYIDDNFRKTIKHSKLDLPYLPAF